MQTTVNEETKMQTESKPRTIKVESGLIGGFWFIGWLFTLAFANLDLGRALLGLIVWPYYLGLAVR
jgi:hypothetical protein